jgi:DNA-binding GntR family transcriptional regulator
MEKIITTAETMEIIRTRIRSGAFVPGQRLVESVLMGMTGASRTRLREALRGLEFEGLIELQEFKGAIIRGLSRDDAFQMWQLRGAIEGLAAGLCAKSDSLPIVRKALLGIQKRVESAANSANIPDFIKANDEFHSLIVETARNTYLSKVLASVEVTVHRLESQLYYTTAIMTQSVEEHREILAAIIGADDVEAEKAMRHHMANNYRHIERAADKLFPVF